MGLTCLGVPTRAPVLITPEEPRVLVTVGGQSVDLFWTLGQISLCSLKPALLSSWSTTATGLSGRAQRYYFSHPLSCDWDSAVFLTSLWSCCILPHPFWGGIYWARSRPLVFINTEPALSLPLTEQNVNPEVWADGKTVGRAKMPFLSLSSSKTLACVHIESSAH